MITKMDKYTFVLYHADVDNFIEKIRSLGLVDITRSSRPMDETSFKLYDKIKQCNALLKRLENFHSKEIKEGESIQSDLSNKGYRELFTEAESLFSEYDSLIQERDALSKERVESEPWGVFNRGDITKLEELGLSPHFYSVLENGFHDEWYGQYKIYELNRFAGRVYFVLLTEGEEDLEIGLSETKFPQRSSLEIDSIITEVNQKLDSIRIKLLALWLAKDRLNLGINELHKELDTYFAKAAKRDEVEGSIALLNAFAPCESHASVMELIDSEGYYYIHEEAKIEDNPPIKLKNNWFSRLFEPIGEMYMLPTYGELDLTPFFAPFYMLFFGLCFGDLGYGLVLLIGGAFAKKKLKEYRGYINLVQFLGLGAVLMASLSGTFFGAKVYELFTLPESINNLFLNDLQMFWFAILFGLFQIIFARVLRAIDSMMRFGWQYGISNIGWTLVIIWAGVAYAATMIPELKPSPLFNYLTGGLGALMIILFSETGGNIFARIGKGTFALYDITGIFGDLLSYIRLFGLGTSGGILGLVVNSVAMNMLGIPYVGWFFTGLMLLIGHTAVLALSSLGAFVHPMRLTFVEFYKNMGFTGGGKAYNPLKKL